MWSNIRVPPVELILERAIGAVERIFESGCQSAPRTFYCCYAGTHASIVAGWCHLGRSVECVREVQELPYFDRRTAREIGVPVLLGIDCLGAEVYALGTGHRKETGELLVAAVRSRFPRARAVFFDVRAVLDLRSRVGGFLSRRMGAVFPGRYLAARALCDRIPLVREIVEVSLDLERKWRDNEGQSNGEVVWLDAEELVRRRGGARPARYAGVRGGPQAG